MRAAGLSSVVGCNSKCMGRRKARDLVRHARCYIDRLRRTSLREDQRESRTQITCIISIIIANRSV